MFDRILDMPLLTVIIIPLLLLVIIRNSSVSSFQYIKND